jgi:hypothetical protein
LPVYGQPDNPWIGATDSVEIIAAVRTIYLEDFLTFNRYFRALLKEYCPSC